MASAKRSLFAAAAAAAAARCSARVKVGPRDRFPSRSMPVADSRESMMPLNLKMPAIPFDFWRPSACTSAPLRRAAVRVRTPGAGQRRALTGARHRTGGRGSAEGAPGACLSPRGRH